MKQLSDKFYAHMTDFFEENPKFVEVKGELIATKWTKGFDLFVAEYNDGYIVSEGKTGGRIAKGDSRRQALISAKKRMEGKTKEEITEVIESAIKKTGLSPRWER